MSFSFQSTLRRTERRRCLGISTPLLYYFNPRSDERSDPVRSFSPSQICNFNPRSDERSDSVDLLLAADFRYFNPRSDERSDVMTPTLFMRLAISIHAPTNGATKGAFYTNIRWTISIHAPTNGATLPPKKPPPPIRNFNPRSDERSDASPHRAIVHSVNFNPRSDERSDSLRRTQFRLAEKFQSTLRRTERRRRFCHISACKNFNPRSDERSDGIVQHLPLKIFISIHAPTNGATLLCVALTSVFGISIHAPTNGATIPAVYVVAFG